MIITQDGERLRVVATVTALNEEETVGDVLDALSKVEGVDAIQLVDDGSSDRTAEIGRSKAGVKVISLPERVPVGEAIMKHLEGLEDDCLLVWCDADLVGLRVEHIEGILALYRTGEWSQVTSARSIPPQFPDGARSWLGRRLWQYGSGSISGERVIRLSLFREAISLSQKLGWESMMRGYGIVLFLNWYCERFGGGSDSVYCEGLLQRPKYKNGGVWDDGKWWKNGGSSSERG